MKKRTLLHIISAALILTSSAVPLYAKKVSAPITPALEHISQRTLTLTKNCLKNTSVSFTSSDFEDALGVKKLDAVTVVSLPLVTDGRLYLGSLEVMRGQTISRSSLDKLRFVPAGTNQTAEASFTFVGTSASGTGGYEVECTMYVLDELNFAPTAAVGDESALCLSTQKGIPVWGTLRAYDPEGDELRFEIVSYPKKGVLSMRTDSGDYIYTPTRGYTGRDSFSYAAYDKYGNRSEDVTVTLDIDKRACDVEYADMDGHWAHNAAIKMTAAGIMNGRTNNGMLCFEPDGGVSRLEFLVIAMQAADIEPIQAADTGFFDDDEIPAAYKGLVAAAVSRGIISGIDIDGLRCFCPANSITRAEAAVILSAITATDEPIVKAVFADESSVPTWADSALQTMNSLGIMSGTGEGYIAPYSTLTRAQTAQMLMRLMEDR